MAEKSAVKEAKPLIPVISMATYEPKPDAIFRSLGMLGKTMARMDSKDDWAPEERPERK